jgi:hypothetical protein
VDPRIWYCPQLKSPRASNDPNLKRKRSVSSRYTRIPQYAAAFCVDGEGQSVAGSSSCGITAISGRTERGGFALMVTQTSFSLHLNRPQSEDSSCFATMSPRHSLAVVSLARQPGTRVEDGPIPRLCAAVFDSSQSQPFCQENLGASP